VRDSFSRILTRLPGLVLNSINTTDNPFPVRNMNEVFISSSLWGIILLFSATNGKSPFEYGTPFDTSKCSLPESLKAEIQGYQTLATNIFKEATQRSLKGKSYRDLQYFVDTFGPRPSGSAQLNKSLNFLQRKLQRIGLTNVRAEQVLVPKMVR